MIRELVLATGNPNKQQELKALLEDTGLNILTLADFPGVPDIEEDGTTCQENAIKKAQGIAQFTKCWALADDTGLEVDALDGRPGVYAARYAGEQATYEDNCQKLLKELESIPSSQRSARFMTVIALADFLGNVETAEGELFGQITNTQQGTSGFGYDPVFFVPEVGKTLAEMSFDEKNRISHRAVAFRKAKEILRKKID